MKPGSAGLYVAQAALLLAGAGLAISGLVESVHLGGVEPPHNTIRRVLICVPLLALTAAYAFVAVRRGITPRAITFFPASYVVLGITVDYEEMLIWKAFAPSEATLSEYAMAYSMILGAVAVAASLLWSSYRAATLAASRSPS